MSTSASQRPNPVAGLWRRLKTMLIADVPEDLAICEFDCSKNQCSYGEWATCQRRTSPYEIKQGSELTWIPLPRKR